MLVALVTFLRNNFTIFVKIVRVYTGAYTLFYRYAAALFCGGGTLTARLGFFTGNATPAASITGDRDAHAQISRL